MAQSDLDAELRRRAEVTAESILSEARADAERITSAADRLIGDRRSEVLGEREAEYGAEARIAISAERHAAMRAVLLAQTRLVDRVLQRARELLSEAARSEAYLSNLGDELTEALHFVDGDDVAVRCSSDIEPAVRDALRGRPEVTIRPEADLRSGFIVVGGAGKVVVDGRLETRIDRLEPTLAIEIRARVEEGSR